MIVHQFGADDKLEWQNQNGAESMAPGDHPQGYTSRRSGSVLAQGTEKRPGDRLRASFGSISHVLFAMGLHGIIRVGSGMNNVTPCGMSMVCRLFMVSRLMMLGGFRMMTGGVRKVV
jgi:hypothetical protein